MTILADALDEAQEPERIAELMRALARSGRARVLLGTRTTFDEGPDRPASAERSTVLQLLDAREAEVMTLGRDHDAVARYVERRLSDGPLAPLAGEIAQRVAALHQPFLFARLATAELLARPERAAPGGPGLVELLSGGHRGLFAAAVVRIGHDKPAVVALLHALALARGRGAPRSGDIWATMARALHPHVAIMDTDVQDALDSAGAYITLDGEAGQSTYRLAHQTFAEHFRVRQRIGDDHRRVAEGLLGLVAASGGWESANPYAVRYLLEHLAAAESMDDTVTELVCDPRWLRRALDELGIGGLLDACSAIETEESPTGPGRVVARALRRSRVALAAQPEQLAAQLCGRLGGESDERLAKLVVDVGAIAPRVWLRSLSGGMDWQSDLDSTYALPGTIGALAFCTIEDRELLAIARGSGVALWDPQRASDEGWIIRGPVDAVALGTWDRRAVVGFASHGYPGNAHVFDLRTAELLAGPFTTTDVTSIAIGLFAGRSAVVVTPGLVRNPSGLDGWYLDTLEAISVPANRLIEPFDPVAVGAHQGRLVAFTMDARGKAAMLDLSTGALTTSFPLTLSETLARWHVTHATVGTIAGGAALACVARRSEPPHDQLLLTWRAGPRPVEIHRLRPDPVGAVAIGELRRRSVVATAPDDEHALALVDLKELASPIKDVAAVLARPVADHAPAAQARQRILALAAEESGATTALVRSSEGEPRTALQVERHARGVDRARPTGERRRRDARR